MDGKEIEKTGFKFIGVYSDKQTCFFYKEKPLPLCLVLYPDGYIKVRGQTMLQNHTYFEGFFDLEALTNKINSIGT